MKQASPQSPSQLIDARIRELADWRGEVLSRIRHLIKEADPQVVEEWKWRGVPVWSHDGLICTGETYRNMVKLTFARGASLQDPAGLFNASLKGNTRRAIDLHQGDEIDDKSFQALVHAAVALNASSRRRARQTGPGASAGIGEQPTASRGQEVSRADQPTLLAGGNPQIAKGDGEAPVRAYIEAMPGWKRDVGHRLDALIVGTVPRVRQAVRWNSPFYGIEGQGWFLSFHCFTRYVKVAFFRGSSLRPVPPIESRDRETRYLHIHQNDQLDQELITSWIRQASELPGWVP